MFYFELCFCVGSGDLAALGILEDRFKPNMEVCDFSLGSLEVVIHLVHMLSRR